MRNMILSAFAFAAFVSYAPISSAQTAAIDGTKYTCAELQHVVAQSGRIGISGRHGYAVYVSTPANCQSFGETTGVGTVFGTADTGSCNVGYSCHESQQTGG